MAIKIVDNSRPEEEKAARRESKQERKKLKAAADSLKPGAFNGLNNAQKLDALRDALLVMLRVENGR
jgi:hypothetical protein